MVKQYERVVRAATIYRLMHHEEPGACFASAGFCHLRGTERPGSG